MERWVQTLTPILHCSKVLRAINDQQQATDSKQEATCDLRPAIDKGGTNINSLPLKDLDHISMVTCINHVYIGLCY
jgi:hypothetical protein